MAKKNMSLRLDERLYRMTQKIVYSPPQQTMGYWFDEQMAEFLKKHGIDPYPDSPKMKETFNEI